ncbi:MAG: 50S ribosomal protein L10 [Candidatus Kerfeldbacteria bacterium]|nr:50S ribosomal protein L10 [Candidatus Kerfeldbacteria bacterium]
MAKTRQVKEQSVAEVAALLKAARGLVFADYTGLSVKELQELRRELKAHGVSYEVAKKTLLARALKQAGLESISVANLHGGVSLAVSPTDEVEPAKVLNSFAQSHDQLKLLGGILESGFIDAVKVKELALLPARDELLGKLVGSLSSPLAGLVNVLRGNLRGLVQVLRTAADKKAA